MILSYDRFGGFLEDELIYEKAGSDEMPTGFILSDKSESPVQKSRSSIISVTDGFSAGNWDTHFLTIYFNEDLNHNLNVRWSREFSNSVGDDNIGTSIAADTSGDVYVSGYVFNYENFYQSNGLDFATIKYDWSDGQYEWTDRVKFFNYAEHSSDGADDKASSIKVNTNKDIYVAGMCDASPYGFSYVKYFQSGGAVEQVFQRSFIPEFLDGQPAGSILNKHAELQLANDGTPLLIVMGWNETAAYWAAQRYDANGQVLYTINNFPQDNKGNKYNGNNMITIDNYPNPFNPSTVISYNFNNSGSNFIQLKVYNMLGKEISTLVNEKQEKGIHRVRFDGSNLSSGIYFYKLTVNGIPVETRRMVLVK